MVKDGEYLDYLKRVERDGVMRPTFHQAVIELAAKVRELEARVAELEQRGTS